VRWKGDTSGRLQGEEAGRKWEGEIGKERKMEEMERVGESSRGQRTVVSCVERRELDSEALMV